MVSNSGLAYGAFLWVWVSGSGHVVGWMGVVFAVIAS